LRSAEAVDERGCRYLNDKSASDHSIQVRHPAHRRRAVLVLGWSKPLHDQE
jgi:hypothetical protein